MLPQTEQARPLARVRQMLADCGYQEVVNFAFVEEAWEADFAGNAQLIRLANPIASHLSVMRSTLIGGLVANVATNLKRGRIACACSRPGAASSAIRRVARSPVFTSRGNSRRWLTARRCPNSGAVPRARSISSTSRATSNPAGPARRALREGRASGPASGPQRARLVAGKGIGFVGELHPQWQQKYELPLAPVLFELDLDALTMATLPHYAEVSRQPPVIRDMAMVVDQALELQQLIDGLSANRPAIVREINLFDVYAGRGVEAGKKSLAFRIVMQDTQKTLLEVEVEAAMQQLVAIWKHIRSAASRLRGGRNDAYQSRTRGLAVREGRPQQA
jgi:phenylalanyl-tRNA synthetase beta chain